MNGTKQRLLGLAVVAALSACAESVAVVGGAPAPVADFLGETLQGRVRLSWTGSDPSATTGTLVVRYGPEGPRGEPASGRDFAPGDSVGAGIAVYYGPAEEIEDRPPCTTQVYAAWTRDAAGRWSAAPATARVEDVPGVLPSAPASLQGTVEDGQIALTWPATPGTAVRLVRQRNARPGGPNDGKAVAATDGGSASDAYAELSPDVTWHYAAYACTPCAECEAAGAHTEVTPTLMQALEVGGFVVYWRHGTDRVCQDQPHLGPASDTHYPSWWARCDRNCPSDPSTGGGTATARQLSPEGIAQAQEIGRALRARGIPFDRTVSSEFCRCTETAETMALAPVETAPELTNWVYLDLFPDRCAAARLILAQPPAPGTNRAVVAHPFAECTGGLVPDLALPEPGQASVFRYESAGSFRFIAKVRWDEWAKLP